MNYSVLVISLILVITFVLTAGCTQNSPSPVETQTPVLTPTFTQVQTETTTPPVTVPTMGMGTPGPTQALPLNYMLDLQVQGNGDTSNPSMAVSIRGGNGLNFDSRVDVTLTRPDGTSSQDSMVPPFSIGQQVVFPCSPNQNRIEIWVTAPSVGKVKTYDQIVLFKSINP
jgi:hypothetical protein